MDPLLVMADPHVGFLVCSDRYTEPNWHAALFADEGMSVQIMHMHAVELIRNENGYRQYRGTQWSENARQHWPQTWFCAPDVESGISVLRVMAKRKKVAP